MISTLNGTIESRLLINYAVAPDVARPLVPAPLELDLVDGHAIAGICLIKMRVRPRHTPGWLGTAIFGGAHRIGVIDPAGRHGAYISRRDSSSALAVAAGGRAFPGVHHSATIDARLDDHHLSVRLESRDGTTRVEAAGAPTDSWPTASVFDSRSAASQYFEAGTVGYSPGPGRGTCEAVEFQTDHWAVSPLSLDRVHSSWMEDTTRFPRGTAVLDHALFMQDIPHTWHRRAPLQLPARKTGCSRTSS